MNNFIEDGHIFEEFKFARNNVQIEDVFLVELHADIIDQIEGGYTNVLGLFKTIKYINKQVVHGYLKATVKLVKEDGEAHTDFSVTYKGIFKCIEELREDDFIKYVDLQMLPLLLPYIRSTISHTSADMGINPPIQIPTLDVIKTIKSNLVSTEERKEE